MRRTLTVAVVLVLAAGCGSPETRRARPAPRTSVDERASAAAFDVVPGLLDACGLARTDAAMWALGCPNTVVRVSRHGGAARTVRLEGDVQSLDGLASDGQGTIWVVLSRNDGEGRKGFVVELDGASGEERTVLDLGRSIPTHAASAAGRLWIATIDGRLVAVDGSDTRTIASGPPLAWVVAAEDRVWTVAEDGDVIQRRASDGTVIRTVRHLAPGAIAAAEALGALWVASPQGGVVTIDAGSGRTDHIGVTEAVNDLERCGDRVWASEPDFGLRALTQAGEVVRSVELDVAPRYLSCDGARLWILSEDGKLGSIDATS